MHRVLRALGLALTLLALTGCDPLRVEKLEQGVSTEVEVRKQFGAPMTVTVQADGTRTLDYPRQPEGWANYVIEIDPDGKMSLWALRQLLNPDNFALVKPGLSRQQVRSLLGRPARMVPYALKNEEVWDWRLKQDGQESRLFSMTFDAAGKVLAMAIGDDPKETLAGTH